MIKGHILHKLHGTDSRPALEQPVKMIFAQMHAVCYLVKARLGLEMGFDKSNRLFDAFKIIGLLQKIGTVHNCPLIAWSDHRLIK
jgi:hypothetical protein